MSKNLTNQSSKAFLATQSSKAVVKKQKVFNEKELERAYELPLEIYEKKPGDIHIQVQVIEAKNLVPVDLLGKSSPYLCMFVLGEANPRAKTKVIKKSINPQWNEMLEG